MIQWIKRYLDSLRLSNRFIRLDRRIDKLKKEKEKNDRLIEWQRSRIKKIQEELERQIVDAKKALDQAEGINTQLEKTLDGVREELRTANDLVIPGLVAASQTLTERWRADIAAQAIKTVASSRREYE